MDASIDTGVTQPTIHTITSFSPASVRANGAQFTVMINGTNFTDGCFGVFGSTTLVSSVANAGLIGAVVPQTLTGTMGSFPISVRCGNTTVQADTLFVVLPPPSPPPVVNTVSPLVAAKNVQFTITVTGSGFLSDSKITFNGSSYANTNFVSANELRANVRFALPTTSVIGVRSVVNTEVLNSANTATLTITN